MSMRDVLKRQLEGLETSIGVLMREKKRIEQELQEIVGPVVAKKLLRDDDPVPSEDIIGTAIIHEQSDGTFKAFPAVGERVKVPSGITAVIWDIDVSAKRALIGMGRKPAVISEMSSRCFGWYPFTAMKWAHTQAHWRIFKKDW